MHDLKINILIIDDDELLLRALKRTLNRLCPSADVSSVQVATQFEQQINNNALPDIIFCDSMMQLPTGKNVLEQAKELCPSALRCLLTGDMSGNYQLQLNNVIHFHLVKPFTQSHLESVINSATVLKTLCISSEHRVVLGQLSKLPFLGGVTQNLFNELNKGEPNISILEKDVRHDPLLAGKVLQIANSAFMGFDSHTSSVKEAIVRIGLINLRAIVVFSELSHQLLSKNKQKAINQLIEKGYKKAELSQSLAKFIKQDRQVQLLACAVGLLSVLGELIITSKTNADLNTQAVPKFVLSAYLLSLWGFDQNIVEAQLIDELPSEKNISLTVIHIIIEHVFCNKALNFNLEQFDFIDDLKLLPDLQQWWSINKDKA
ncbi:HDOD domain-containing protein [Pseudoalteromonas sp. H71]|uniref:HDOD domain-containing protein n=1 Tax=Pseudoalteromonas sp. H71 TaxID=1348395 RepID=UPI0007303616|nr:HDOD domain-containing protein [Pseudoalteromonas sp. H71]KTD95694.1 response regulator [Pseudoalteromonas sp. H71]